MEIPWLDKLKQFVEKKPIAILGFGDDEWTKLQESRRGVSEFTVAHPHALLEAVKIPTVCLIQRRSNATEELYFGLISSRAPVTTLESRIKVIRVVKIECRSPTLLSLVKDRPHMRRLKEKLSDSRRVVALSPKLSIYLIERLRSIRDNIGAMRAVTELLFAPKRFRGIASLQEDAVRTALMAFGLAPDDRALLVNLAEGCETALAHVGIMEDSVIEHDARDIPGYQLVESGLTGRAIFERGNERLEVFTANRRPLERAFGVDLIYLNATMHNIVMLQYKMLEPSRINATDVDWIYRPDHKLKDEIRRMHAFSANHVPGPYEYRLNSAMFYLKFVKRDAAIRGGGILMPIDHFKKLSKDPLLSWAEEGSPC